MLTQFEKGFANKVVSLVGWLFQQICFGASAMLLPGALAIIVSNTAPDFGSWTWT